MRRILQTISLTAAMLLFVSGTAAAQSPYTRGSTGVDVSWANCSQKLPIVGFGIVGVTNGEGYSTNPCLSTEATSFLGNVSLYVNTGWYSQSGHISTTSPKQCASSDENCIAYNYGYNAGVYAYEAALNAGVHNLTWWLDVETINTWNSNTVQNQNSLQGEYDALVAKGAITVGVYSTSAQWQTITGNWKNKWPNWGATTWTSPVLAQTYCVGHQFTNGESYLMQYKSKKSTFDQDVAC